jgi:hypothetical protein
MQRQSYRFESKRIWESVRSERLQHASSPGKALTAATEEDMPRTSVRARPTFLPARKDGMHATRMKVRKVCCLVRRFIHRPRDVNGLGKTLRSRPVKGVHVFPVL